MKSFFIKTLPIFLLFISLLSWGQQDNFPVKKINGTDYYVYTVQQGEGLYSISKRFGVSQAEINNLNPQIHEGLKAGQEIVIPVNEKNIKNTITSSQSPKSDKEKSVSKKETEIVKHVVLKKQTLFAISRIYNISIDDIKKYNPEVENGLKEGMILSIPIDDTTKAETEKINKQSATNEKEIKQYYNRKTKDTIVYIEHIVKEKETLYSISKLYNTEIQSIIDLNPKSDDKLKIGSKLKILKTPASKITENEKPIVSAKAEVDNVKFNTRIFESVQPKKTPYKIAFLLPFMVGNSKADASIDKFIEFYSGALIAIQEAKEHGISFEISTFDTEKSEEKIQEVLQNPELKNMDLIIGPAYTNQIPFVSDFSKENKINTLIPFSSKVYDVNVNPYLLQFNPGIAVEVKFIAEMLNNEYRNDNIVFCDVPSVSILDDGYEFAFELQNELRRL
ncbi:MAG: LysM peptidoglycan-binding domain-containing protein, partial [Paludibacter sp.]|nr:LysM peptidoglycan-binding domain-containing protein [Paludibacter sp.]